MACAARTRERRADPVAVERGPAQRVRRLPRERDVLRVDHAALERIEQRAVARDAHLQDLRLGAAHRDLLAVDRERLPRPVELNGGAVLVQPLDVEVLDVAADVGDAPRVVRRRAQDHPGREGERHPARLVARRREVELQPDAGLRHEQVRVVREQRLPARGVRSRHHPVVRALTGSPRQAVEDGAVQGAGGVLGRTRGRRREQGVHRLVAGALADPRAQQLVIPVPRQAPRQQRVSRRPGGLVLGELGTMIEEQVLDGGHRHRAGSRPPHPRGSADASRGPRRPSARPWPHPPGGSRPCARTDPGRACAPRRSRSGGRWPSAGRGRAGRAARPPSPRPGRTRGPRASPRGCTGRPRNRA